MGNQQLTKSQSGSQLARPSSTSEAAAIMRRFEQLSELTGWAGILHALAQDKRHDLAPHVIELWKVKLEPYRDEDIAKVLLRGEWRFFPSVDEVIYAVEVVAQEGRAQREQGKLEADRRDAEAARESWEDPKQQAELENIVTDLGKKLTAGRMRGLSKAAPPENMRRLQQQARVLAGICVRDLNVLTGETNTLLPLHSHTYVRGPIPRSFLFDNYPGKNEFTWGEVENILWHYMRVLDVELERQLPENRDAA